MSYLHDYADRPEVVAMFPSTEKGLEIQREQLAELDSVEQRLSMKTIFVKQDRDPNMRCWRLYVIARQSLNALLDEVGLRPPLDMFKSFFGIDSMSEKIATASTLLSASEVQWDELIEVKRIWPSIAAGYVRIGIDEIEGLFRATVELYLEIAESLGLKGVIVR